MELFNPAVAHRTAKRARCVILTLLAFLASICAADVAAATDIHVPADQPTIQAAINVAFNGDTVIVADGTYTGAGNKDIDFFGKLTTVKSANGPDNCIIDCQNSGRGFYLHTGETSSSVVDGFTIQNGSVSGIIDDIPLGCGAGICCYNAGPTIQNCIVTNNTTNYRAGGIYSQGSTQIINCVIVNNTAMWGGGLNFRSGSTGAQVTNCVIADNQASSDGGATYAGDGGVSITFTNCLITNNTGYNGGGMIFRNGSNCTVTGCTIADNHANYEGGAVYIKGSLTSSVSVTVTNCIVWGNAADYRMPQFIQYTLNTSLTRIYCDLDGGGDGAGNIDVDPLFVGGGDYHLQEGSPCIDAGNSAFVGYPTDLDGNTRIVGIAVDMGCYESDGTYTPPTADFVADQTTGDTPLTVSFTDLSTATVTSWEWDFGAQESLYRKAITISNPGSALTDYQVKMTVSHAAGKMQSDFADLRFAAADGETLLGYWIEQYTELASATVWIRVLSIPAGDSTIYMYYGNPDATAGSNGEETFFFFDDFSGSTLDTNKWQQHNGGVPALSGGQLTISATGADPGKLIAKTAPAENNYVLRARFKVTGGANTNERAGLSIKTRRATAQGYNYVLKDFTSLTEIRFLEDAVSWLAVTGGPWSMNTWYLEEIAHDGTNVWGRFDDGTWYSIARSGRLGFPALNFGSYDATSVWDFAAVRKYAPTEPTASIAAGEELVTVGFHSTEKNPTYTYRNPGVYTVTLTVTGPGGSDQEIKANYIIVGQTVYVNDATGDDGNDGSNPSNAVKTIQRGLDLAGAADWTVLVADGTYTGTSNTNLDFAGKAIHLTSINDATSCIIDCQNTARAFYFHNSETNETTLEGFTITNGYADDLGANGGAIYCDGSHPTIRNCRIINSDVNPLGGEKSGGGIYLIDSDPTLANCIIAGNSAYMGGGIYCAGTSSPTITSCTIADNSTHTDGYGGGICCAGTSSPAVSNTIFWGNTAAADGNQVYTFADLTWNNCDYADGSADVGGSGSVTPVSCIYLDPLFVNATSGDYRLDEDFSPCIDAGDDSLVPLDVMTDIEGKPRVSGAGVDIGAHEVVIIPYAPVISVTTPASPSTSPVTITYGLTDDNDDNCTVTFEYSSDNGSTWNLCTPVAGDTNPASDVAPGAGHTFDWKAVSDLPLEQIIDVMVRATADDNGNGGTDQEVTGKFAVDTRIPLEPPTNFNGVGIAADRIVWTWDDMAGATAYLLEDESSNPITLIAPSEQPYANTVSAENAPTTRLLRSCKLALTTAPVEPVGTVTSAALPWSTGGYHSQYLYRAAELAFKAGTIKRIFWQRLNSGPEGTYNDVSVSLGHTTKTSLDADYASNFNVNGARQVRDPAQYIVPATGASQEWTDIPLDRTFYYNGTDNLVIDINVTSGTTPIGWAKVDVTGEYPSAWGSAGATIGNPWEKKFFINFDIEMVNSISDAATGTAYTLVHDAIVDDFELALAGSGTEVIITVTEPPNSHTGLTGVKIERATNNTFTTNATTIRDFADTYIYTDTTVATNTTYWYRITFRNFDGMASAESPGESISVLGPDKPPAAYITAPSGGTHQGEIPIAYDLADFDSDPVGIVAEYSTDGGGTWDPCTMGSGGDGTTPLTSSLAGTSHIYVWDSETDGVGAGADVSVQLKITPSDKDGTGAEDITTFTVNNPIQLEVPSNFTGVGVAATQIEWTWTDTASATAYLLEDESLNPVITVAPSRERYIETVSGENAPATRLLRSCTTTVTEVSVLPVGVKGGVNLPWSAGGYRSQHLYTAAELAGTAGTVKKIYWQRFSAGAGATYNNVSVAVGHTTKTSLDADCASNFDVNGSTVVRNPAQYDVPAAGAGDEWVEIPLDGGFYYNGTDNLVIDINAASGDTDVSWSKVDVSGYEPSLYAGPGLPTGVLCIWKFFLKLEIEIVDATGDAASASAYTLVHDATTGDFDLALTGTTEVTVTVTAPPNQSAGLTGVKIERATDSGFTTDLLTVQNFTDDYVYTDTTVATNNTYWYRITYCNGDAVPSGTSAGESITVPQPGTNVPPIASIAAPAGGTHSGNVEITYSLTDTDGDPADITAHYSLDSGATWSTCTEGPGGDGVSALDTSASGTSHIYVWDTVTDDVGTSAPEAVQLRITPTDKDGTGTPGTTTFTVSNVAPEPPGAAIASPTGGTHSANVEITYSLTDTDGDPADITAHYSLDSGATWGTCTDGPGGDGVSALATSTSGTSHIYVWDTVTDDVGTSAPEAVQLRITPTDKDGTGTPGTTTFTVSNGTQEPPGVTITNPTSGTYSANITITYILTDANSDTCSITAEYTTDGGGTWGTCGQGPGGDGVTGLDSSLSGTTHSFVWASANDNVGRSAPEDVQVRITPHDGQAPGSAALSSQFTVDNTAIVGPVANFTASPTSGDASLTVQFTNTSTGNHDSWSWDFDDDGVPDSNEENPTCTYRLVGTYSVTLTVDGPDGDNSLTKTAYITVTDTGTITAGFTGLPVSGNMPLSVQFTDMSIGDVTSWSWDFGDGATSTERSPTHPYTTAGAYTVALTVSGPSGNDTRTRTDYISVSGGAGSGGGGGGGGCGCKVDRTPTPRDELLGYLAPVILAACAYLALRRRREFSAKTRHSAD